MVAIFTMVSMVTLVTSVALATVFALVIMVAELAHADRQTNGQTDRNGQSYSPMWIFLRTSRKERITTVAVRFEVSMAVRIQIAVLWRARSVLLRHVGKRGVTTRKTTVSIIDVLIIKQFQKSFIALCWVTE
jgi:hypothetical protein